MKNNPTHIRLGFFVVCALVLFLASCTAQDTPQAPVANDPATFTSAQAGIPEVPDAKTLAYIKAVKRHGDAVTITIDPVQYIDCRKLENDGSVVPKICLPKESEGGSSYAIIDSHTAIDLELLPDAGPYFLKSITGEETDTMWKVMDVETLTAALAGTALPSGYYDADVHDTPNLFYVLRKGTTAQKVFEKYRE